MKTTPTLASLLLTLAAGTSAAQDEPSSFMNWETPHCHPIELTPDGNTLLAVNLPAASVEVYDLTSGTPVHQRSIPVGLDPVSVRARSNTEAWVVNQISDSVNIIDLTIGHVKSTIYADDEPCDVVFAGSPERAFISCSQENTIIVYDPSDLDALPQRIELDGEEPRALEVSADGMTVYCAFYESGNRSAVLGNGGVQTGDYPPDVLGISSGPYLGVNPPPNDGANFDPPLNPALPTPPEVSLIVKEDAGGAWRDDNGTDWSPLVDGQFAPFSGRIVDWGVLDHDIAAIDTGSLTISYGTRAMNICMDIAVHPVTNDITMVGTDATNEVRFEPVLNGRFLRVLMSQFDPVTLAPTNDDLNPHLDYTTSTVAQNLREQTLSDPRSIVWNSAGTRAYVAGLGTNNVAVFDASGNRVGAGSDSVIPVGEGPTGLAIDDARGQLYVLNRFDASVSVIDTTATPPVETSRLPFFDPTPAAIKDGRPHLYDALETSGLGLTSCASCHVDARTDRLPWDLGDPSGDMRPLGNVNSAGGVPGAGDDTVDFHPMKGPMLTQTMQDIIGKEPFHWRGDRSGIEEFNGAFEGLLGDDEQLTAQEMQAFENYLATIAFPPNPYRNPDNTLPTSLDTGEISIGTFSPAGTPLPIGNAVSGKQVFRDACGECHTLATGLGTNMSWDGAMFQPIPPGPNGEDHHNVRGPVGDGIPFNIKVPSLRGLYERRGTDHASTESLMSVGFRHDGGIDSLSRFVFRAAFGVPSEQAGADVIAFLLCISGEPEVELTLDDTTMHPGSPGLWTHALVGVQLTYAEPVFTPQQLSIFNTMTALDTAGDIDMVLHTRYGGEVRGGYRIAPGQWQMDRDGDITSFMDHLALVGDGQEFTLMAVPKGSGIRLGIDKDLDGHYDRDELDAGSDPMDPNSVPRSKRRLDAPRPGSSVEVSVR